MAIPSKQDQYFTELKVKYIRGLVTSTASLAEVEFWLSGIQLEEDTYEEFKKRQPDYGDAWKDLDLDTLCGQVRAEANRIRPEMEREKLRHRIVDTVAYLTMLYRLTEEQK